MIFRFATEEERGNEEYPEFDIETLFCDVEIGELFVLDNEVYTKTDVMIGWKDGKSSGYINASDLVWTKDVE